MREEKGNSWIAETREALTGSTSVVVLHGNLDDIYYTDMHQGLLRLKEALKYALNGKDIIFCTDADGLRYTGTDCKKRLEEARKGAPRGRGADTDKKPGSKDPEGARLLTRLRTAQGTPALPDPAETLEGAKTALRHPNFAVVFLWVENFMQNQAVAHAVRDLIVGWSTGTGTVAEGSLVVLVTGDIGSIQGLTTVQNNGRVRAIKIPRPDKYEFGWVLEVDALRHEEVPFRGKDIPALARAAVEAGLSMEEFVLLVETAREKKEQLTTATIRNHRWKEGLDALSPEEALGLKKKLDERVVGQERAKNEICRIVKRARANLNDPRRPLGALVFTGPTGIGKTLLARSLAQLLFGNEDSFICLDMGEYAEPHSVARAIGSPPGYVGHEEGGELTSKVAAKPNSVVLFDEAEKAHQQVWKSFLQLLDEGRLTDGRGRTVDFTHTIIILTSNAGSREARGKAPEEAQEIYKQALHRYFAPEFLGRFDAIVPFEPLSPEQLHEIAKIEVRKVVQLVEDRHACLLDVRSEAVEHIAQAGSGPEFGARSIRRKVEEAISDKLSEFLLANKPTPGTRITMTLENGEITFSAELPLGDENKGKKKSEKEQGKED